MDIAFFAPETWALFIRLYIYNNIVYSCAPNPTLIHNPKTVALCCCCSWWHLYDWSYIVKNTTYCDSTAAFASKGAHRWRNSGGKKSSSSSTYIITQNEALQPRHLVLQVYRKQTLLSRYFYIRYFKTDNFVFYFLCTFTNCFLIKLHIVLMY